VAAAGADEAIVGVSLAMTPNQSRSARGGSSIFDLAMYRILFERRPPIDVLFRSGGERRSLNKMSFRTDCSILVRGLREADLSTHLALLIHHLWFA